MKNATHSTISPSYSGVVQFSPCIHSGYKNTSDIAPQLSYYNSVRPDKKTWPATFLSRTVGTTNPDVIICSVRSHGSGHCYCRKSRPLVDVSKFPNIALHFSISLRTYSTGMNKNETSIEHLCSYTSYTLQDICTRDKSVLHTLHLLSRKH